MLNPIKKIINFISGHNCHARLTCALDIVKKQGRTINREQVARKILGGLHVSRKV